MDNADEKIHALSKHEMRMRKASSVSLSLLPGVKSKCIPKL